MRNKSVRRLARLGMAGGVILLFTGCPEDAADIVEITTTILDFDIAPQAAVSFPRGDMDIENLALAAFDTTVDDAFGRETTRDYGFVLFGGDPADPEWVFDAPLVRSLDPRAPTLIATDPVTTNGTGLFIDPPQNEADPAFCAGPFCGFYFFIISGALEGLPPNTTFTVALVRLAQEVKGELDQAATLLGNPITQPDSLVILNPNPGGDPTVVLGVGGATVNRGDTINVVAGANPLILGNASTNASGTSDFGIVVRCDDAAGTPVFFCSNSVPITDAQLTDSVMFGRNDGVNFSLPRYNYVVLYEGVGVPTDATPMVARWQVGQDIGLDGNVLNNGAAPFPPGALTTQDLIAAPGGAGAPDSISIEVFNAEPLGSGAAWSVWLMNLDESPPTLAAATGVYEKVAIVREIDPITGEVISETDSVLASTPGTNSFAGDLLEDVGGNPQEIKHRLTISDASMGGGDSPGFYTHVVVSLEASAGASAPSSAQTMWFQYTDQSGTPTDFSDDLFLGPGTMDFGTFNSADPDASTTFGVGNMAQATGFGGLADTPGGTGVNAEMRNLPIPPVGWYYEGWLTNPETGVTTSLGPIRALPPDTTSLFDADIDETLPSVTPTGIRFSCVCTTIDPSEIITGQGDQLTARLTNFFLTLEPKVGGSAKNIADLEVGNLPTATIINRRKSQ